MKPTTALAVAGYLMNDHDGDLADRWSQADVLLIRQAIEDGLNELCDHYDPPFADCQSWRAKFLCAGELLGDDEIARRALTTWSALSRACHHLDYDLPPTVAELEAWMAEAAAFTEAVDAGTGLSR